jgi:hypothetical protein
MVAVGTSSTFRKVPYHSRDDAQEAHGASDLKLPVAQVLSPIPGVPELANGRRDESGETKKTVADKEFLNRLGSVFSIPKTHMRQDKSVAVTPATCALEKN